MKWIFEKTQREGARGPVFFAVVLWAVLMGVTSAWAADNSKCFVCHREESLSKVDEQGKKVSLSISMADYKGSIHAGLSCSDCHAQIRDDTHARGTKQAALKVDCAVCHRNAEKEYERGLHSKLAERGTERAASCQDCHGKHNIRPSKDPQSQTNLSNSARTCSRCHSN